MSKTNDHARIKYMQKRLSEEFGIELDLTASKEHLTFVREHYRKSGGVLMETVGKSDPSTTKAALIYSILNIHLATGNL